MMSLIIWAFSLLVGMGLLRLAFSLELFIIPYLKKEVTTGHPEQAKDSL